MPIIKEFFLNIPAGKPSPDGSGKIIKQKKQDGDTCSYYAMNYLRTRRGEISNESVERNRRGLEKDFSQIRKLKSSKDKINDIIDNFIAKYKEKEFINEIFDLKDFVLNFKDSVDQTYVDLQKNDPVQYQLWGKVLLELSEKINSFVEQERNAPPRSFFNWLNDYKIYMLASNLDESYGIYKKYKLDPEKRYQDSQYAQGYNQLTLSSYDSIKMNHGRITRLVDSCFFEYQAKEQGIEKSNWFPSENFNDFYRHFTQEGPYYATGHFGKFYHNKEPIELSYMKDGRKVFYWPSGSYKYNEEGKFLYIHAILVVGVQQVIYPPDMREENYIYYIDTTHDNAPDNKAPLYVELYDTFVCRISNTYGWYGPDKDYSDKQRWFKQDKTYNQFLFFSEQKVKSLTHSEQAYQCDSNLNAEFPQKELLDKPEDYSKGFQFSWLS